MPPLLPHSPKGVIFDCDGVLISSFDSTRYYFNRILAAVGRPPMTPEQERYCFVASTAESIRAIVPPERLDDAFAEEARITAADLIPRMSVMDGLVAYLDHLERRGVPRAVLTNGGSEARSVLRGLDLLHRFQMVVTAHDVSAPKPDPEGALRILSALDLAPADAIYIGDSDRDQLTAQAARVPFVAFRNPVLPADRHIGGFDDLAA